MISSIVLCFFLQELQHMILVFRDQSTTDNATEWIDLDESKTLFDTQ